MSREQLGQIVIRPPEGMREAIRSLAAQNNRSMNAETVFALQQHIEEATRGASGWRMMPPEYVIGDVHQDMLQAMAEETGRPVQDVLQEAIRRYFSLLVTDKEQRERALQHLSGEILDLVRHHLEREGED